MTVYTPAFDGRSAEDWLAQAERFESMAERFEKNPQLVRGFRHLAEDARERAKRSFG